MEKTETKKKILIVDDEPAVRDVFKQILVARGYKVVTASDGKEGFETFQETKNFDLVIMDMMMPGLNGIQTLKMMRLERPHQKAMFITGQDKTGNLSAFLDKEKIACLFKPVGLESLLNKVATILATKK